MQILKFGFILLKSVQNLRISGLQEQIQSPDDYHRKKDIFVFPLLISVYHNIVHNRPKKVFDRLKRLGIQVHIGF